MKIIKIFKEMLNIIKNPLKLLKSYQKQISNYLKHISNKLGIGQNHKLFKIILWLLTDILSNTIDSKILKL